MASKKPSSRSAFLRSSGRKAGRPLELKVKLKPGDRKKLKELMSRGRAQHPPVLALNTRKGLSPLLK